MIQQPLTRCGIVEDFTDEGSLRSFANKVAQAFRGRIEPFEEKGIDGRVARGQLRGVKIPALVITVHERVEDVLEMKLPGLMNSFTVFGKLARRERRAVLSGAMRWHRKNIRRSIGQPDARARESHLHDLPREVAGKMGHVLMGGGDVPPGGVIVSAKMRGDAASAPRGDEGNQIYLAAFVEDGLRRFDHQLEAERAGIELQAEFETRTEVSERGDFLGQGDFWKSNEEIFRKFSTRLRRQLSQEDIQGADAAIAELFRERFDTNADEWRQAAGAHT